MSKCDFKITFDRPDRTYCGGEQVSGTVQIDVNREFTCDAVVVEHFWRTHGRGNRASGGQQTIKLPPAAFRAGETQTFPFQFFAPDGPPTYHGTYLNVDHYVKVYADIPWAIDPKKEEDFILRPGRGGWGDLPHPLAAKKKTAKGGWGLMLFATILLAVASVLWNCFGLFLGVVGTFMLIAGLRNVMAQSRVGELEVQLGAAVVSPGGQVPVKVRMTPGKSFTLNAITAKLVGREECVSGSGTNKSTHKHVLHEQVFTLASSVQAMAGRTMDVEGVIEIPATEAYSFHAPDNELVWSVELRIDVPLWPDWTESHVLTLRPATEGVVASPGQATATAALHSPFSERDEEDMEGAGNADVLPELPLSGEPATAVNSHSLAELAAQLLAAPRYGPERDDLVAQCAGVALDCVIEVERIDPTFGYVPDDFRDGRTIVGKLVGTDCRVSLQLPASRRAVAEALESGQQFHTQAEPVKWDIIYDRLDLREAP